MAQYPFIIGEKYRRRDVYSVIGIPEDTKGGVWDTGYARHENDWFIFCNVGIAGRTGHDYANQWIGDDLKWYGKTTSHLGQPSIQAMLNRENNTYVFWRESNEQPFIFAGIGISKAVRDSIPVEIIWTFDNDDYPDEVNVTEPILREGSLKKVTVNAYERNRLARNLCIEHYGVSCSVCNFNFEEVFGEIGKVFIHVHHLKLLSEIGEEYVIDPIEDLRPVCPNCHSMIHKRKPPFAIDELQALLNQR